MTVRFFVHSVAKRAEAIALIDSGATENFMNLSYARWLRLPIKRLEQTRKLFNVDGTENRSRELQFYTDLLLRPSCYLGAMRPLMPTFTSLLPYLYDRAAYSRLPDSPRT